MKKFFLALTLILSVLSVPAIAQTQEKYAVGNMYTKALNMIKAEDKLDAWGVPRSLPITNIHIDHGQVLIALDGTQGPTILIYDPIANLILASPTPQ